MESVSIRLPEKTLEYAIHIDQGLLASPLLVQLCQENAHRWVLITDTTTESLYGGKLQNFLSNQGVTVELIAFPAGEAQKTRQTKGWIEDQMLSKGLGRDSGVIALGGGIVTDLAGFVASTYCRGIPLIQIPTTLLAMVDASIGGKTAVNVPEGKNLIGTVYQPLAVLMDIAVLKTLPSEELRNGIVESIKHGLILDQSYFNLLETHRAEVVALDFPILKKVILRSCELKGQVVQKDEHETGMRRLLNFGHTFGHALETLSSQKIAHGHAVALGILAESYLSMELGILPKASFKRIMDVIVAYGIPLALGLSISPDAVLKVMKLDKKAVKSSPRFVILKDIGNCLECEGAYCQEVDSALLLKTAQWLCDCINAKP